MDFRQEKNPANMNTRITNYKSNVVRHSAIRSLWHNHATGFLIEVVKLHGEVAGKEV